MLQRAATIAGNLLNVSKSFNFAMQLEELWRSVWLNLHLLNWCPVSAIQCQIAMKSLFFGVTVLSVFIQYADESEQKYRSFRQSPFCRKGWRMEKIKSPFLLLFSIQKGSTLQRRRRGHQVTQQPNGNRATALAASFMSALRNPLRPGTRFLLVTCALVSH